MFDYIGFLIDIQDRLLLINDETYFCFGDNPAPCVFYYFLTQRNVRNFRLALSTVQKVVLMLVY